MAGEILFDKPPAADGAILFGDEGGAAVPGVPYVPSAALVFDQPPAVDGALLFDLEPGEAGGGGDVPVTVALQLPGPSVAVRVSLSTPVRVSSALPGPSVAVVVRYASNTQRPLVARAVVRWQDADHAQHAGAVSRWQDSTPMRVDKATRWQDGRRLAAAAEIHWDDALRFGREGLDVRYQDGLGVHVGASYSWQDALRFKVERAMRFQRGLPVGRVWRSRFQDGLRNRGEAYTTRYQDARPYGFSILVRASHGRLLETGWSTRYQDAKQAIPGRTQLGGGTVTPPFDPCYTPNPALLFQYPAADFAAGQIVFFCDNHPDPGDPGGPTETVVVPVRRIYRVINSATLVRVDGGVPIPAVGMSLTIDVDSWTWGFTARTPSAALPLLEPASSGEPVEVEATINGLPYRFIVEGISRDRTFGRSDLVVSGRGKAALLDAPYAPIMTFANTSDFDLQQLARDVLTFNGVSIGWDVDAGWEPTNWQIPAGVFSFQGTYIGAINAIAQAAGAYVQPHPTAKALRVKRRYPAKPWEWSDVDPDYELPADVVQKEAIVWTDKPNYNRVFVRGMRKAILGQVTSFAPGDLEAPMVTDQLITHAVGARQRAMVALCDVGRQAAVSLRLPVLSETGIIAPGKFVRYVDGDVARIGLVRSSAVEVDRADDRLTIWQTIGVETHV